MRICIIGGGTTGWWCAGYMEKFLPDAEITLIESDNIPIIGVGESTLPMIKTFFDKIGVDESKWMPECNAIHKYGNVKTNWDKADGEPFAFTFWYNDNDTFSKWYKEYEAGNKTKHQINDDLYDTEAWRAVAYHLDAEKAGQLVKDNCKNVIHKIATLDKLPEGYDLYVDCTGFRRQFVKDKTETVYDHHLVDSAWVCPFEHDKDISHYTESIARENGWQFVIDLTNRIGTGYVFSSQHTSDEEALKSFKEYNAHRTPFMGKEPRLLKWKPNILTNPWTDNVVAVGLSNGFIDPLESNALFMTQYSITLLVDCIKRNAKQGVYNRSMRNLWKENSEYILHHYMLSKRTDTDFWKYYSKFDVTKTLWNNYTKRGNKYTNLYPDAIWATLGLYHDEFKHYEPKDLALSS